MKLVLTGTGTSQGIPVIGCRCEVCTSTDPKDTRLRTAAFLSDGHTNIAIDAGPDFRQQMLKLGIDHLDGLILTHEHNDHVAGLDDIRPFNFIQHHPLRVYALKRVADEIKTRFAYIFADRPYPGAPQIELVEIDPYKEFTIGDVKITPFTVMHGEMEILGLRNGTLAYITDANFIPPKSINMIEGIQILIINALHHERHHSHFNLSEAIEQVKVGKIPKAFFTHISHRMGLHGEVNFGLPKGIELGYDGLTIAF